MAKPIKIRNRYYHRARVPLDLVATFGETKTGKPKTEITIALGTPDWVEAKRRLPAAEIEADALFDAHRQRSAAARHSPSRSPLERHRTPARRNTPCCKNRSVLIAPN